MLNVVLYEEKCAFIHPGANDLFELTCLLQIPTIQLNIAHANFDVALFMRFVFGMYLYTQMYMKKLQV